MIICTETRRPVSKDRVRDTAWALVHAWPSSTPDTLKKQKKFNPTVAKETPSTFLPRHTFALLPSAVVERIGEKNISSLPATRLLVGETMDEPCRLISCSLQLLGLL